jgi:predicted nucleotidyltransferase component of viral defense system
MMMSREKLQQEANSTGFRVELLEKVFMLMRLLTEFSTYPQLKNKLVLKGGTALNLFFFNLPRLSVDIDLNYIGCPDREGMLADRLIIQSTVISICERNGLILDRNPTLHAGGKMVWRYPSALGQMGNLEIDLNFMYRIPLWPILYKSSCLVGSQQIHAIPVLDIHELSAGKLCALIDRKTGRDLFDAYHLLTKVGIDFEKLRLALVIYSCMSKKIDLRKIGPEDINVNIDDLKKRLIPMLKKSDIGRMPSVMSWSEDLLKSCQDAFCHFLPINNQENAFLISFLDRGIIEPHLISTDSLLINNISQHPAIQWRAQNIRNG